MGKFPVTIYYTAACMGVLDPQEKGELCSVLCKRELNSKERKGLGRIPLPAVTAARKLQALIYVLPQSTAITGLRHSSRKTVS